jgi:hypothetical protein
MGTKGKRIGRPTKKPKTGERVSLGLRVTAETKQRLDAAAAMSGRSQSQEAEMRLERSFERQDLMTEALTLAFGEAIGGLLRSRADDEKLKALLLQLAREKPHGKFSYDTYLLVNSALGLLRGPVPSREEWEQMPEPPTNEEFDDMVRRHEKIIRGDK